MLKRISKNKRKYFKFVLAMFLTISSIIGNSYAAIVSDNDGSAFITKSEFDALKSTFQSQIDSYNQSIDSKIDGAIAAYLSGIQLASIETQNNIYESLGGENIRWCFFDDTNLKKQFTLDPSSVNFCGTGCYSDKRIYFCTTNYNLYTVSSKVYPADVLGRGGMCDGVNWSSMKSYAPFYGFVDGSVFDGTTNYRLHTYTQVAHYLNAIWSPTGATAAPTTWGVVQFWTLKTDPGRCEKWVPSNVDTSGDVSGVLSTGSSCFGCSVSFFKNSASYPDENFTNLVAMGKVDGSIYVTGLSDTKVWMRAFKINQTVSGISWKSNLVNGGTEILSASDKGQYAVALNRVEKDVKDLCCGFDVQNTKVYEGVRCFTASANGKATLVLEPKRKDTSANTWVEVAVKPEAFTNNNVASETDCVSLDFTTMSGSGSAAVIGDSKLWVMTGDKLKISFDAVKGKTYYIKCCSGSAKGTEDAMDTSTTSAKRIAFKISDITIEKT